MTTNLDGAAIDLDRVQTTLDGGQWLWTCEITESGDPLMQRLGQPLPDPIPLFQLYGQYGPLTARTEPTTAAMYRQVLETA
jgi:hypothetical protein